MNPDLDVHDPTDTSPPWAGTGLLKALGGPFPILLGLMLCWTLATPIFAVPDEPTQVVKAAAVARGELVGQRASGPYTAVQVPAGIIGTQYSRFVYQRSVPASCEPPLSDSARLVDATSYAGLYPPLYYALVGWPTLIVRGDLAIYLMRALTALLAAFFLAGAFRSAASSRSRLLLGGLALVVTPYVLYFGGSVNASGLEMPVAICAWTTGLVLFGEPGRLADRRLIARFALALLALVQIRGLGPFFGIIMLGALVALFGVRPFARFLSVRSGRTATAVVGICAVFCAGWTIAIGGLALLGGRWLAPHTATVSIVKLSAQRFGQDLFQMVGMFGWWNATFLPRWDYLVWFGIALATVAVGLLLARGRARLVTAALVVVSVAVPVVIVAAEARSKGIVGQGRYWLPLVAGAVLVAAHASRPHLERWFLLVLAPIAVLTLAVQVAAFRFVLDRYRFGLTGPRLGPVWAPPLGAVVLTAAYVVLIVLLCSWWWRASRPRLAPGLAGAALRLGVSAVVAGGALALGGTTAVAAATTVSTWSAGAGTGADGNWSDAANWATSQAPSGSVTTSDLVFPPLAACHERGRGACVVHDDVGTTAAHSVSIGSGATPGYTFTTGSGTTGSGSLTVGSGGLDVTAGGRARTTIGVPIVLGADQVWNMSGGVSAFDGSIGGSKALTLNLSAGASLDLKDNLDVGDLSVIDVSGSGPRARVTLNGGDLNGGSGSPMATAGIALGGYGHLGPLAASRTSLTVGRGYAGPKHGTGSLTSSADLSLDSFSGVTFDDLDYPGSPGDGYPQLAVTGVVTLGSASLRLDTTCRPSVGDSFPIVTGRSISGTFTAGGKAIANGDVVKATAVGARCTDYFKIVYSPNTVTAVDVGSP